VFPVRYGLNLYLYCLEEVVFKGLIRLLTFGHYPSSCFWFQKEDISDTGLLF
jgi:hypothetical protein